MSSFDRLVVFFIVFLLFSLSLQLPSRPSFSLALSILIIVFLHLVMSAEPPPLYTPDVLDADDGPDDGDVDPQILIIPPSGDAEFQKGYLGVEGERAAVEGELQIKGIRASACQKV